MSRRFQAVGVVVACAGCWTQQVSDPVVTRPQPAYEPRQTAWRGGVARVVPSQPCASTAPFTVEGLNKTRMAANLCGAFERAWAQVAPTTSIKRGTFDVEFELREATVREATGLVQCDVAMRIQMPRGGPASQGVSRAQTADDCAYQVLASLLIDIVGHMQAVTTTP